MHIRVAKNVKFLEIHRKLFMAILIVPFQNIKFKHIFNIQNTYCLHEWFSMGIIFANSDNSNDFFLSNLILRQLNPQASNE